MMFFYSIVGFFFLIYLVIIWKVNRGLSKLIATNLVASGEERTNFSILISARNEEAHIARLLDSISNLNYPTKQFEVIIVDDRSEDRTAEIIRRYQEKLKNLRLLRQDGDFIAPKKAALRKAIAVAKHEVIITTDADCIIPKNNLKHLSSFYEHGYDVVAGPVDYSTDEETRFWQKLVTIDFLSLISFGAGFIGSNFPIICNGANFSYRKACFEKVEGFKGIDNVASGDDDLLLDKFHKEQFKISYSWNFESIVKTEHVTSLKAFYEQRKRWGSKGASYTDIRKRLIMFSIFFFYTSLLSLLFLKPLYFLLVFSLKFLMELAVMRKTKELFKTAFFWKLVSLNSLLQIPYVVFIGIMANIRPYSWK